MTNKIIKYLLAILSILLIESCSKATGTAQMEAVEGNGSLQHVQAIGHNNRALPKAVVYKTNGDYNNNVMIPLNSNGKPLTYPAPQDVSIDSAPIVLGDGWLLDRRGGVSPKSVFLNYTYQDYAKLAEVPTINQLMKNVIPGASVTEIITLPITLNQALTDIDLVKSYLPK